VSRRARRHVRVPPDLTSLFDVLFIVIFAALIRAAAAQHAAAEAAKPPPKPAPVQPLPPTALQAKALAQLDSELAARPTLVARITAAGQLSAIETAGKVVPLDLPLVEHSPDPDVALSYLGDRSVELRLCRQLALHLGVADLAPYLVIFAPDAPRAELPHALYEGMRVDVDRCQLEQHGLAVIVEPIGGTP
jgi:hypothetical protein